MPQEWGIDPGCKPHSSTNHLVVTVLSRGVNDVPQTRIRKGVRGDGTDWREHEILAPKNDDNHHGRIFFVVMVGRDSKNANRPGILDRREGLLFTLIIFLKI